MNRPGTLAITIAALSALGMAFAAVAAPYTPKPANATAAAQRSALLNILANDTMRLEIASHITISAKLFVELSVIVSSPPSTILHCETRLPLARMCRSQTSSG